MVFLQLLELKSERQKGQGPMTQPQVFLHQQIIIQELIKVNPILLETSFQLQLKYLSLVIFGLFTNVQYLEARLLFLFCLLYASYDGAFQSQSQKLIAINFINHSDSLLQVLLTSQLFHLIQVQP
jgi:hypothetical protein